MNRLLRNFGRLSTVFTLALFGVVGCSTTNGSSQQSIKVTLTGDKEVPPVKTTGSGVGTFVVSADAPFRIHGLPVTHQVGARGRCHAGSVLKAAWLSAIAG